MATDVERALFVGEFGLAAEYMVGFVFKRRIPISRAEFECIRAVLLSGFGVSSGDRDDDFLRGREDVIAGLVVTDAPLEGSPIVVVGRSLPYFDLFGSLDDDDLRELASVGKGDGSTSKGTFEWLLLIWTTAVLVLEREARGERPVWNPFGVTRFAHTMDLRDRIERMVPMVSDSLRAAVERWVAAFDERLVSFTVDHTEAWEVWKSEKVWGSGGPWWERVPAHGPVADEFDAFAAEVVRRRAASEGSGHP